MITFPILYALYSNDINKDNMLELKNPKMSGFGLLLKLLKSHFNPFKKNILDSNPELTNTLLDSIFGFGKYTEYTPEGKPEEVFPQDIQDNLDNIYKGKSITSESKQYIKSNCLFITGGACAQLSAQAYNQIKQASVSSHVVVVDDEKFAKVGEEYKSVRIAEHNGVKALHYHQPIALHNYNQQEQSMKLNRIASGLKSHCQLNELNKEQISQVIKNPTSYIKNKNSDLSFLATQCRFEITYMTKENYEQLPLSMQDPRVVVLEQKAMKALLKHNESAEHKYRVVEPPKPTKQKSVSFQFSGVGDVSSLIEPTIYEGYTDYYLVDYKGQGLSKDQKSTDLKELCDSCTEFVAQEIMDKEVQVKLTGVSLGGAVALSVYDGIANREVTTKPTNIHCEANGIPISMSEAVKHVQTDIEDALQFTLICKTFRPDFSAYSETIKTHIENGQDTWQIKCFEIFSKNKSEHIRVNKPIEADSLHKKFMDEWNVRASTNLPPPA